MKCGKAILTKDANGNTICKGVPIMTKEEIYDKILYLTSELANTRIAEKIFDAVDNEEAERVNSIIAAFPDYYPALYQKIIDFGEEYNALVGNNEEYEAKHNEFLEKCKYYMSALMSSGVIGQIAETDDTDKLQQIIATFKREYPEFSKKLVEFQKDCNLKQKWMPTGTEGKIFAAKADEEHVVFDYKLIEPLSFYVLLILANIAESYLFCYDEDDDYINAIAKVTNEDFAEFVASYNIVDWFEQDISVGELLIAAFTGQFEDE